eukprot:PhM_4_TR13888/c1_g2_i1/m.56520/K12236/NFX1; transcriptional repressor NF-X1
MSLCDSMLEQLKAGTYECVVCVANIKGNAATWACPTCYRMYHMFCIKKWGRQGDASKGSSSLKPGEFHCPTCKNPAPLPKNYKCFCGKVTDPVPSPYHTPHSCGDACGKKRGVGCVHPCPIPCHPGPCPPCTAHLHNEVCHCTKKTFPTVTCSDKQQGLNCGGVCGKPLRCGNHTCVQVCHAGPCTPCPVSEKKSCPCGKSEHVVPCGGKVPTCRSACGKTLSCGNHKCSLTCHEGPCEACPLSPSRQLSCNCGRVPIETLQDKPRTSCTDPIPSCGKPCEKLLMCHTHKCNKICHMGPCGDCEMEVKATCPCGGTKRTVKCVETYDASKATQKCTKKCGLKRSCGRHTCNEVCCALRPLGSAAHECNMPCGRKLPCGHKCPDACHTGACPPCIHFITTELACPCGATVLMPPLPCNTQPPTCTVPCRRPSTCDHMRISHPCHDGPCPPCVFPVDRMCAGGHGVLKNVPCHAVNITCGKQCGHELSCGHTCSRGCHVGPCINASTPSCTQICGKGLPCGHTCAIKCHAKRTNPKCPPCTENVKLACPCGVNVEEISCRKYNEFKEADAVPVKECDEKCEHHKRLNALGSRAGVGHHEGPSLADALGVGGGREAFGTGSLGGLATTGGPYSHPTATGQPFLFSVKLWETALADIDSVRYVERQLCDFVDSREPQHLLPKMNAERRGLVHELALYYGIQTVSLAGPPDRKSIDLSRTVATHMPSLLLSAAVKHRKLDPRTFLKDEVAESTDRVLIFENCDTEGMFPGILHALRQFIGLFVLVLHPGTSTTRAVFTDTHALHSAYGMLRRSGQLPMSFHYLNQAPPPRHHDPTAASTDWNKPDKKTSSSAKGSSGSSSVDYRQNPNKPKAKNANKNRFAGLC